MSIDFTKDIGFDKELTSPTFVSEDDGEVSLRPQTLSEYIGQEKAREILRSLSRQPKRGRSLLTTFCSTALRDWARPPLLLL